ncbi:carbohydrate ABC transporter permease [Chloroflexota bacterium]
MAVQTASSKSTVQVSKEEKLWQSRLSGWVGQFFKYVLLIALAFSFILPFYWMASSAVKDDSQVFTVPPIWLPSPAHWNNYWDAWTAYDFNRYALNTVVKHTLPVTIGTVLSSTVVAYGFSRLRWPGRDVLFYLCLMTMMVPYAVVMVPLFITFKNLGWINTYLPLVVPSFFGNPFFIFLLRQFFMTIPQDLTDAARIDGAGELGILFRVILPLTKPALAVVALLQVVATWNDYLGPLIYLQRQDQYTIALGLENLRVTIAQIGATPLAYPYLMAVSTIVTLPILIVFFFAQRTFIEGISVTGLKG